MTLSTSSDILEQQFGPTELTILYQTDDYRIICTRVKKTDRLLELSFVSFKQPGAEAYPEVHQSIMAGQSMGKAFQQAGIEFERRTRTISRNFFPDLSQSNGNSSLLLVSVLVGPDKLPYAEILETYTSEVSWPD